MPLHQSGFSHHYGPKLLCSRSSGYKKPMISFHPGSYWHHLTQFINLLLGTISLPAFWDITVSNFLLPLCCSLTMPFAGSASYSKSFSGGVPQESVLGLFFFCLHSCLGNLVQSSEFHLYELPQIYFFSLGFSPEYLTLVY